MLYNLAVSHDMDEKKCKEDIGKSMYLVMLHYKKLEDGRAMHGLLLVSYICHENDMLYKNCDDVLKSIYRTFCYPQKMPKTT